MGNYPRERRRLFDLVLETGAEGVILLSGNAHFAELSQTGDGPCPLLDFTSSGLTHVNETYPEAPGGPIVKMAAIGVDGQRAFEYRVAFASLSPRREGEGGPR